MDAHELAEVIVKGLVETGKVLVSGIETLDANNVVIDLVIGEKNGSITIDLGQ